MRSPLALVIALLVSACGATTRLGTVWSTHEQAATPFSNVLVLGIGTQSASRRVFEDVFATALVARGTRAIASYRSLPSESMLTEAELAQAVERGGFDGVVVTRLLAVDQEERYVPPQSSVSVGMGRGYYGHYGSAWGVNYSPGYVSSTTTVRLDTRVYRVPGETLVWTAESSTFQPSSTEDTVQSVTKAVISQLAKDGWLR